MSAAHADLLQLLVVREVRVRYVRTALGVAWALFPPLAMAAVFSLVGLGRLIGGDSEWSRVPYPAFALTGLVFWNHLSQSLLTGTTSLAQSRDMLHKSRFPSQMIPLSKSLAWLLDLGIGVALLLVVVPLSGLELHATALLVPLVFALQFAFTAGLVLFLSALNLFFRDVQYVLQVAVLLLMFASNVVYPVDAGDGGAAAILALNPVVAYLDAYRRLLLLGELPELSRLLPGIVGAALSITVGALYFRRVAPRFPEEV